MKPKFKRANQRVYKTKAGELVPAGDPKAAVLFAGRGTLVREEKLTGLENADEFFIEADAPLPVEPTPKVRVPQRGKPTAGKRTRKKVVATPDPEPDGDSDENENEEPTE